MHSYVHCSIIYNGQYKKKTDGMSINIRMDEDIAHIYTEWNILSHKNWNLAICDSIEGPRQYYTKQKSKKVRERQTPYDFTPIWNQKEQKRKKERKRKKKEKKERKERKKERS